MIIIEASWIVPLQVFIGSLLPVFVGLVTTKVTHSGWKGVLLLGLSFVTSILTQVLASATDGRPYDLTAALLYGFGTFILGVAVHMGLLKPAGISEKLANSVVTAEPVLVAEESETTGEWQVAKHKKMEN